MDQVKEYAGPAAGIASGLGTILAAKGNVDTGKSADLLAKYQARQLEQNAGQEIAVGTQAAEEEKRKSDLIASRAIAVAAASGAGALDPTVIKIMQGISAEGDLASATQMYNANERARGLRDQAKAVRFEGKTTAKAYKQRALNTIMAGSNQIANTWGSGAFKDSSRGSTTTEQIRTAEVL